MGTDKPRPTLTEVLKTAIEHSGVSRYRIAQETGIPEPSLCRFMQGLSSLRLDKADALAGYLGLRLTPDPDAIPPRPTPANLARPMLAGRQKRPVRRRSVGE